MKKKDEIQSVIDSKIEEMKMFANIFNVRPEYVHILKERFDHHYELYNQMIEQDNEKDFFQFLLKQELLELEIMEQNQEHFKSQKK